MKNTIKQNIDLINTTIQDTTNQINKFTNKMNDIKNKIIQYEFDYNNYFLAFNQLTDDIFNKKNYNKAPLLFDNICCLWSITNQLGILFEDYKYYLSYYLNNAPFKLNNQDYIEFNFNFDFSFIDGLYWELHYNYNSLVFCSKKDIINSFKTKKEKEDLINLLENYFNRVSKE